MRRCFSFFVSLRAAALLALLLAGCAARQDEEVWSRLGVRPPVARAVFESRLPRGWTHRMWGLCGCVQFEQYLLPSGECYEVDSHPTRAHQRSAGDVLVKITHR